MTKNFFRTILLIAAVCLWGCASENSASENSDKSTFDWYTQKFSINDQIKDNPSLSVTDFQLWEQKEQKDPALTSDMFYGTDGTNFYTMECQPQTLENICLSIYDPATGNRDQIILPTDALKEDPASFYITAASLISPENFSIQITSLGLDEKGNIRTEQCRIIRMSLQGEILSDVDMLPLYEAQGLITTGALHSVNYCFSDADDCIYNRKSNRILIADNSGNLLMAKAYADESHTTIGEPVISDDGKLIFPVIDSAEKTVTLVWFDTQNSKEYVLAELEYPTFQKLYAMRNLHLYYGTQDCIIDWDIISGNRSVLFHYRDNAILNTENAMLSFDAEGNPILRVIYENEELLLVLGEESSERETIRIADLSGSHYNLLKSEIAAFSRRNPLYHFSYEYPDDDLDADFRNRIMAELTSGTGPDILYLSREDLSLLHEKGILEDMKHLISQNTLQELLPGAVDLGCIGDSLSGIPGEITAKTIFTLPEIWNAAAWSIDDILNLVQNREQADSIKAILPTTGDALLYYLVLLDLEHSAFIDWESNSCCFSTEEFINLLKAIKAYSLNETLISDSDWEMLREGKCLGVTADILSFTMYESHHKKNGEDIITAGFPTETGHGNYLSADGILAVNVNSPNKEVISDFLEYILSIQGQSFCNVISVRKTMLSEDNVFYDENNRPYLKEGTNTRVPLDTRKDGAVYIQQYNEFLESCVPLPDSYNELVKIISEEAELFLNGNKSPEQTAQAIDGRVQTYLDEHNLTPYNF